MGVRMSDCIEDISLDEASSSADSSVFTLLRHSPSCCRSSSFSSSACSRLSAADVRSASNTLLSVSYAAAASSRRTRMSSPPAGAVRERASAPSRRCISACRALTSWAAASALCSDLASCLSSGSLPRLACAAPRAGLSLRLRLRPPIQRPTRKPARAHRAWGRNGSA